MRRAEASEAIMYTGGGGGPQPPPWVTVGDARSLRATHAMRFIGANASSTPEETATGASLARVLKIGRSVKLLIERFCRFYDGLLEEGQRR